MSITVKFNNDVEVVIPGAKTVVRGLVTNELAAWKAAVGVAAGQHGWQLQGEFSQAPDLRGVCRQATFEKVSAGAAGAGALMTALSKVRIPARGGARVMGPVAFDFSLEPSASYTPRVVAE